MIIKQAIVPPTMNGVGEVSKATIRTSARVFDFLSNQIYADKYTAILRELVANAVDSHIVAKEKRPVEVTLATTFTPYIKIRDYGASMGHDFVMGPFMAFADASTKENSNDQIGAFGLGSKSPLSYTDQYAIHCYLNGTLRIYSVFKDEEGCPAIAFLSKSKTTEPNGVEISFPVEQGDITKFKDSALKCLRYFDPLPILKNCDEQLASPEYTVRAKTFGFRKGETQSQIVQGGVAYPIDKESVPRSLWDILDFGIDFYVPIGSVGIALSRERLSYDDSTIRVLTSLCEGIRPQIKEHVNKMFEAYPTKWEAIRAYCDAVYGNTSATRLIEQLAEYKGEKLQRYMSPVHADKVFCAFVTGLRWQKRGRNSWTNARSSPTAQAWVGDIYPTDIDYIILDDAKDKPVLRMRNFLENMSNQSEGVMIVRKRPDLPDRMTDGKPDPFVNDLDWATFIKDMGSPPVIMLSTIEPAVVSRNGTALTKRPEKIRAYMRPTRTAQFVDTLPAGGGIYVEMDNFSLVNISGDKIQAIDPDGKLILYFNKGDINAVKNNPKWTPAIDKFNQQMTEYKKTHKNLPLVQAFAHLQYGSSFGNSLGARLFKLIETEGFTCPKRGPFHRFNTLYQVVKPQLNNKDAAMRKFFTIDSTEKAKELNAIVAEIKAAYPELTLLIGQQYVDTRFVSVYNKLV